jgi:hypothetical protein
VEAQRQQCNIELNEALEHERQQAQATRDIQDALAQQFLAGVRRHSQELQVEAERAHIQQRELENLSLKVPHSHKY